MKNKKTGKRSVIAVSIIAVLLITATVFMIFVPHKNRPKKRGLTAGMPALSFVTGLKNGQPLNLSDKFYNNTIILSFTDKSPHSEKLLALLAQNYSRIKTAKPDIMWLDLNCSQGWIVLTERMITGGTKYRFPVSALPALYDTKNLPVIYVIDEQAVIKMVYRGYSPTAANDIIAAFIPK